MTAITHLECRLCRKTREAGSVHGLCACGGPLLVRYDLAKAREVFPRAALRDGVSTMWRYGPLLPVRIAAHIVSLGEGMTPLLRMPRLGDRLGVADLRVKDEGKNPTGSVEARGFSCVVSMAKELGLGKLAISSTGNAGAALAAYAAAAGLEARISLPHDAPRLSYVECKAMGAKVTRVEGPLKQEDAEIWLEPYRLEGEKTIGYELAEQLDWQLPDAVLCPVGAGLAGISKAFEEMAELGWVTGARPRVIGVPAVAGEMLDAGIELAAEEGILSSPEAGACVSALRKLLASGRIKPDERIVICNTASGLKYLDAYSTRFPRHAGGEADKLGGLITPR